MHNYHIKQGFSSYSKLQKLFFVHVALKCILFNRNYLIWNKSILNIKKKLICLVMCRTWGSLSIPQNLCYVQFSRSQTTRKLQIPFLLHICDFTEVTEKKQCTYNIYCIYGKTNNYINDAASLKIKLVFKCITSLKIFYKRLS